MYCTTTESITYVLTYVARVSGEYSVSAFRNEHWEKRSWMGSSLKMMQGNLLSCHISHVFNIYCKTYPNYNMWKCNPKSAFRATAERHFVSILCSLNKKCECSRKSPEGLLYLEAIWKKGRCTLLARFLKTCLPC